MMTEHCIIYYNCLNVFTNLCFFGTIFISMYHKGEYYEQNVFRLCTEWTGNH